MAQNYYFYGVAGVNGYGVFDDYKKVLAKRNELQEVNTKGFFSFHEAKEWSEERYIMLQEKYRTHYFEIELITKLNRLYFRQLPEHITNLL